MPALILMSSELVPISFMPVMDGSRSGNALNHSTVSSKFANLDDQWNSVTHVIQ